MTFAEKLTELRTGAELTQAELAAACGVPAWTIRNYEQGKVVKVPFSAVVALAKALGTDCTAFAGCSDVAAEEEPEAPPAKPKKGKK